MVTYVNDLRLSELATGEGSGTWGTTTNTNLELIGEALGYGTEQSFSSDADATTTIGDGVSDPARAMYFKVTSAGSLTATRTLTIAPNTVSRVMFIENATTGSQSIAISQGSGANVTIATGKTAVVYLDGAGSGAAVVDALALVDPGVTDTLAEVLTAGNTTTTDQKIQFRDTGIYINSSADGQLDIVADTEIQIAATTIDINGAVDMASTLIIGDSITQNGGDYLYSGGGNFDIKHTVAGQNIVFSTTPSGGSTAETLRITSDGKLSKLTGNLTLDVAGNIILDADGGDINLLDGGTQFGQLKNSSSDFVVKSIINNQDLIFQGVDGGSPVTALTLDMSASGRATFNNNVVVTDGNAFVAGDSDDFQIYHSSNQNVIQAVTSDQDIIFKGKDDSSTITALTLDMSDEGAAIFNGHGTFNDTVTINSTSNNALAIAGANGGLNFTGGGNRVYFTSNRALEGATDGSTLTVGEGFTTIRLSNAVVANEAGADRDFRVESSGNTHALFVEGDGTGTGINTSDPQEALHVTGSIRLDGNNTGTTVGAAVNQLIFKDTDTTTGGGQPFGEIDFVTADSSAPGISARIAGVADSAATAQGRLTLYTGAAGTLRNNITMAVASVVVNEGSADMDFRVESNGNANMLVVDGGANRVAIGSSGYTNDTDLNLLGDGLSIKNDKDGSNNNWSLIQNTATSSGSNLKFSLGTGNVEFTTGGTIVTTNTDSYHTVFNEGSANSDFRVESNDNANMLFVDGGSNYVSIGTATNYASTFNVGGATALNRGTGGATTASGATLSIQGTGSFNSNYFGSSLATVAIRSNEPANDGWNPTLHITTIRQSLGTNNNSTGGIGFTTIDDSNSTGIDDAARITIYNESSASTTSPTAIRFYNNVGGSKTQGAQSALDLFSTGAVFNNDSNDMDFRVESDTDSYALFVDASTSRVAVGRSNPQARLDINAGTTKGIEIALGTTSVPYINFLYGATTVGSITTNGSTTAYNTTSDQRLKDNIVDAPSASDDIDAIQVRSFDWKANGSHQKYGMVAQELQAVAPEAVSAPEDLGEMMSVDYSKLVPMLIKEIQSLRARVADLES